MVVDGGAVWAVSDGGRRLDLHRLDPGCGIVGTRTVPVDPYDIEDLAHGPDGMIVAADTGDNALARDTIGVVVLPARGEPRLHRLSYPDGPHDAEALVVDADGRPVVITKEVGRAGVYRAVRPPEGPDPTPLERVGQVVLPASTTPGGPLGGTGSRVVTGAATTDDRRVVALRSYTDAWLFAAPDGDPVAALGRRPVQVPLPDEPQGEAIAFAPDGTLLSGSEARGGRPGEIRAVPGAADLAGTGAAPLAGPPVGPPADPTATPSGPTELAGSGPAWWPAVAGAGAVVGVLLLGTALLAWRGSGGR